MISRRLKSNYTIKVDKLTSFLVRRTYCMSAYSKEDAFNQAKQLYEDDDPFPPEFVDEEILQGTAKVLEPSTTPTEVVYIEGDGMRKPIEIYNNLDGYKI